ncbi:MAG: hypothetical protein GXO25_07355 [Euryarchaeota archaeon]|nr:hypothetical protein [Euryarchaeota archaeon]
MNVKSKVVIITLLMLFSYSIIAMDTAHGAALQKNAGGANLLASSGVIRINNNTDFATQAAANNWPGNGSATNPYIISGYVIDAKGAGNVIYIGNTTVHFVIENCTLFNASRENYPYYMGAGISLYSVTNASIFNNTLTANLDAGIDMLYTSNSSISNNNINSNQDGGMMILESENNTVTNNNITNNSRCGIVLEPHSENNTIIGNTVSYNGDGIHIYMSNNTVLNNTLIHDGIQVNGDIYTFTTQTIENNTVDGKPIYYYKNVNKNNTTAPADAGELILANVSYLKIENLHFSLYMNTQITVAYSNNIEISNCTFTHASSYTLYISSSTAINITNNYFTDNWNGITAESSNNLFIFNNTISNSSNSGISLSFSVENKIVKNLFANNSEFALELTFSSNNNIIYNNSFYYNYGSGDRYNSSNVQAYDDYGDNNLWNTSEYGNYWRDWNDNSSPYSIAGGASKDFLPLRNATFPMPPLCPTKPLNLTTTTGDKFVNLSWLLPLGNGSASIEIYRIYRNNTLIATVPATQLYYNDTNVTNGVSYTYFVTAVNSVGESPASNSIQATPGGAVPEFGSWSMLVILALGMVLLIKRKNSL